MTSVVAVAVVLVVVVVVLVVVVVVVVVLVAAAVTRAIHLRSGRRSASSWGSPSSPSPSSVGFFSLCPRKRDAVVVEIGVVVGIAFASKQSFRNGVRLSLHLFRATG